MKLIELEDTTWFPQVLRDQQLGYIGWLVQALDLYRPIGPMLEKSLANSDIHLIQDLCSGSGQPMASIAERLSTELPIRLSDLYPPEVISTFKKAQYIAKPVDVLQLQFADHTLYTMFNAFHHFDDDEQQRIVNRIKTNGSSFLFVEILEPTIWVLLKTLLANIIGQLLLAPFVRPFHWTRLLFTYLIPINLLTTTYDGIISVFKSKNKKQYQSLLTRYADPTYDIQITKCKAPLLNSLVIIQGFPSKASESA